MRSLPISLYLQLAGVIGSTEEVYRMGCRPTVDCGLPADFDRLLAASPDKRLDLVSPGLCQM